MRVVPSYEIRPIRPHEWPAYWREMASAFAGGPADIAVWERIMASDPDHGDHNTLLLTRDDAIVSACHIAPRTMHYGHSLVNLAGVGSVFTVRPERNRGHATALLEHAVLLLRERGFDLALLSTKIPAFYQRLGWRPIPRTSRIWRLRIPKRSRPPAARQFSASSDVAAVIGLHRQWARSSAGALLRSEEFWHRNMWYQEDMAGFLVADAGGEPAAYARSRLRPGPREPFDLATIQEIAWQGDRGPLLEVIAATLAAARRAGALRICESIPAGALPPDFLDALAEKESERVAADFMGLVLDWQRLAASLQPELQRRLSTAGPLPASTVTVAVEGHQAHFSVNSRGLEIQAAPAAQHCQSGAATVELEPTAAVKVLFEGWDVACARGVNCPPAVGGLLRALLPPVAFYHWTQGHY